MDGLPIDSTHDPIDESGAGATAPAPGKATAPAAGNATAAASRPRAAAIVARVGAVVAALAILVGNRLLPVDLPARATREEGVFWGAWVLALAHGWWRTAPVRAARIAPAWLEQCWAITALGLAAVVLNAATTGDHLGKSLGLVGERYWPVAGVDLALLAAAALAWFAARHLAAREKRSAAPTRNGDEAPDDAVRARGADLEPMVDPATASTQGALRA